MKVSELIGLLQQQNLDEEVHNLVDDGWENPIVPIRSVFRHPSGFVVLSPAPPWE